MGLTLNDVPRDIVVMQKDGDGSWRKIGNVGSLEKTWGYPDGDTFTAEGLVSDDEDEYVLEKKPKKEYVLHVTGFEFKPTPITKCEGAFEKLAFNEFSAALSKDSAHKGRSKRDDYLSHLPEKVIVSGPCVISVWKDGTKTISRCHDGDEMDVQTGITLNAIKKWMPGGTYWQSVIDDVEVEYQEPKAEKKRKAKHEPVDHDHPGRPYMRGGKYGDDEKIAALEMLESGLTLAEVSRRTGISSACLCRWRRDFNDKKGAKNGA